MTVVAYVWCGLCAAFAGAIAAASILGADANNTGLWLEAGAISAAVIGGTALSGVRFSVVLGVELDTVAAIVIGGTLLTGGYGFTIGNLIGVLIQGHIQTYITFHGNLSSWWTKIVTGILLFLFITLQLAMAGLAKPSRRRTQGAALL